MPNLEDAAAPPVTVWPDNLALFFQELYTAIVRVRSHRQEVNNADVFRNQVIQAIKTADQNAKTRGYTDEDVKLGVFALVAFLDESVLSSGNPVFANWPRLPLQAELFHHQLAGEMFFQELQKSLSRSDSQETADLLEVYYLCLLLGFKGRYAAGGDLRSIMGAIQEKIRRVRGPAGPLSPRGAIPADAVRLAQSDRWSSILGKVALITVGLAVVLFVVFKVLLMSGASSLSGLVAGQ